MEPAAELDLAGLGLDQGGHLLVRRALRRLRPGEELAVRGSHPDLQLHLAAFCRGHGISWRPGPAGRADLPVAPTPAPSTVLLARPPFPLDRRGGAERAGKADARAPGALCDSPPARWGLAARGALVEAGGPEFHFPLATRDQVWAEEAIDLYAQAAAAQWDPATAVDWQAPFELPDEVEEAVVQVMTYLIENETAALIIPAHFAARIHPHFREVVQVLAIQAADEARHIEVFTRRALLKRPELGLSTAGGQLSLRTLVEEPDFALASFLLSVMGEGTFLTLLWFLHEHAPDPVTRQVARLAAQDEARHVAFGLAHLTGQLEAEPGLRSRLRNAVEQRHDALRETSGLNEEVSDALCLLAAGSWENEAVARGFAQVTALRAEMDRGRQGRLRRLGFPPGEAEALSGLHTRNFM